MVTLERGGTVHDAIFWTPSLDDLSGSIAFGDGLRNLSRTSGDEGRYNTAVGVGAMRDGVASYYNVAVGYEALKAGQKFGETAVGFNALRNTPIVDRYDNTAIGALALLNC